MKGNAAATKDANAATIYENISLNYREYKYSKYKAEGAGCVPRAEVGEGVRRNEDAFLYQTQLSRELRHFSSSKIL